MSLFALPKVLADLVKAFKSAPDNKVLAKQAGAWSFDNPATGGTTDHAALTHLDFASSGHTGFAPASVTADLTAFEAATAINLAGKASLEGGKVPASQLPSYVDDVLEFAGFVSFPVTGESGKIYVALDTNLTYRWSGSAYAEISASLALGETSATAYRGDRGKTAYDHSQISNSNPHNAGATQLSDYASAIQAPLAGKTPYHGFTTRAGSTLAFDNGTRTFTLGNTAPYDVYHAGVKTIVNAAKTVTIPNTLGQHFIWMNADGTLGTSQVVWDMLSYAIIFVATVHWDGATGIVADERHDYRRNLIENRNQHDSWGAQYVSGFTPTPTFTDANTFTFAGGVIRDEDLYHTLTTPQTTCRIGYRVPGGATMTFDAPGTAYAKLSAGVPQYDNAGTLTALAASRYMNLWVYATNRPDTPITVILGQNSYTAVAAAQGGAQPTLAGLSVAEWKLLYRVIVQNLAGALKFIQADVLYNLSTGPAINAGTPTTLSAGNVTVNTSNFGGNLTAAETTVQAALDKIDDMATGGDFASLTEISITGAATATISRMHVCSGTTADYTVTLPTLSTGDAGKVLELRMALDLTKLVTVDAGAGVLIDGQQTRVMWAGEVARLRWTGAAWVKIAGKSLPMTSVMRLSSGTPGTAQTIAGSTSTTIQLNQVDVQNVGMGEVASYGIRIKRPGRYFGSGIALLAPGQQIKRFIGKVKLNSTAVGSGETSNYYADPLTYIGITSMFSAAAGDLITLEMYQINVASVSWYAYGSSADQSNILQVTEILSW